MPRRDVTRNRFQTIMIAVGALLVLAAALWLQRPRPQDKMTESREVDKSRHSVPSSSPFAPGAVPHDNARPNDEHSFAAYPTEDRMEFAVRLRQLYEPPALAGAGTYPTDKQDVAWEESCQRLPELKAFKAPSERLAEVGLRGTEQFPGSGEIVDFNQYFRHRSAYVQLSINWDGQSPPLYTLSAISSPTPESTENSNVAQIPDYQGEPLTRDEALALVRRTSAAWLAQGAVEGYRTMVLATHLPANGQSATDVQAPAHVAEFRNARVVSYSHGRLKCRGYETLRCLCL